MIILEDLPPEERKRYIESKQKLTQKRLNGKKIYKYKSTLTNIFIIKDKLINKSIAENIFEVILLNEYVNFYDFDIKTTYNEIKSGLEFIPDLFKELLNKMSSLKNHLILRVDKQGMIKEVLNQNELTEKWRDLKNEILQTNEKIPEKDIKKILEAGDKEYTLSSVQMAADISKMLIYKILFNSFMDKERDNLKNGLFIREFTSSIFPEVQIEVEMQIKEEPVTVDDDYITQVFISREINVNEAKIKKIFLNNYAILKESFKDYNYNSIAISSLEKATLWPLSINFGSKEKINTSVSIEMELHIEQID